VKEQRLLTSTFCLRLACFRVSTRRAAEHRREQVAAAGSFETDWICLELKRITRRFADSKIDLADLQIADLK
jgi:hypothetical protein